MGVPRETVVQDYLLTNRYLDPARLTRGAATPASPLAGLPPAVQRAYVAADRSYIEAAFAVIDGHRGGSAGYLRDELGLSAADLARLRRLYTS